MKLEKELRDIILKVIYQNYDILDYQKKLKMLFDKKEKNREKNFKNLDMNNVAGILLYEYKKNKKLKKYIIILQILSIEYKIYVFKEKTLKELLNNLN